MSRELAPCLVCGEPCPADRCPDPECPAYSPRPRMGLGLAALTGVGIALALVGLADLLRAVLTP